ncbi:hypothetical protein DSUL_160009 [Desulfovibrionales bacterium]
MPVHEYMHYEFVLPKKFLSVAERRYICIGAGYSTGHYTDRHHTSTEQKNFTIIVSTTSSL